jgi:hypothetical protein
MFTQKCCRKTIFAFNFKLLHNIVATPYKLWKWKIIDTNICHLCFNEGTLEHMMIKCCYFDEYYVQVKHALKQIGFENVNIDMYTLICGHKPNISAYNTLNLILNIVFFNVYKCWVKIKIDREYINPLQALSHELTIRCHTKTYCHKTVICFTNVMNKLKY